MTNVYVKRIFVDSKVFWLPVRYPATATPPPLPRHRYPATATPPPLPRDRYPHLTHNHGKSEPFAQMRFLRAQLLLCPCFQWSCWHSGLQYHGAVFAGQPLQRVSVCSDSKTPQAAQQRSSTNPTSSNAVRCRAAAGAHRCRFCCRTSIVSPLGSPTA